MFIRNPLSIFIKPRRHAKTREENNIKKLNKKFLEARKPRGAGSLFLIVPMRQDTGVEICLTPSFPSNYLFYFLPNVMIPNHTDGLPGFITFKYHPFR
jgi:hypothetical protein